MFSFEDKIHQADWIYCQEKSNEAEAEAQMLFQCESPTDVGGMQILMDEVDRQNELLCDSCAKMEALYDVAVAQETRKIMCEEPEIMKASVSLVRDFARAGAADVLKVWAISKHRMNAFEKTAMRIQSRLKFNKPLSGA